MSTWNETNVETLKTLWADGLSASQIAARMGGGVTRNAVIGKRIRLGLPDRVQGRSALSYRKTPKPKSRLWGKAKREVLPPAPYTPPTDHITPPEQRKTLLELTSESCRFPYGEGTKRDPFTFCGKPRVSGLPYCEPHREVAFLPPQPRRVSPAPTHRDQPVVNPAVGRHIQEVA